MPSRPRVLFVCHEATRSGAPVQLLHFLRWLRTNGELEFSVLILQGGELESDFAELAPTTVLDRLPDAMLALRAMRRIQSETPMLGLRRRVLGPGLPDLVFLNTAACGSVLPLIPRRIPILTYVYELSFHLHVLGHHDPQGLNRLLQRTGTFVGVTRGVAMALQRCGVPAAQIEVCTEFLPIQPPPSDERVDTLRLQLGINPDTLLVGSMGTIEWRKGPDVFIALARRVLDRVPAESNVGFLWCGAATDYLWEEAVRHDLEASGLREKVRFVGAVADPEPAHELMDIFASTSRVDTLPIAGLEAAAHAKPVLCFDRNGLEELLEPSDRLCIPYLNVDAMADRIADLLSAPDERNRLGGQLAVRVRARHHVESVAPQLLSLIHRALDDRALSS